MHRRLKRELLDAGAVVVGFASLGDVLHTDLAHLGYAVSIGVDRNLNENTIRLIMTLQRKAAGYLKKEGYRCLCIPPDSDRINGTFISRLYPFFNHKMAATSAGLGWIGKNGLFINREYGPRLSLGTVLTDAELYAGKPVEFSFCGDCTLCLDYCPSQAITGNEWSRYKPFTKLVMFDKCRSHKKQSRGLSAKPNCGLCVTICPYGRENRKNKLVKQDYQKNSAYQEACI